MKKLICITLLVLTTNLTYSQKDSIVYGLILQINDTYFSRANCYTGEIEVLSSFPISNYYSTESGCAYNSIDSIYYFIGEDFGGSTKLFSIKTETGDVEAAVELPHGPIYKHLFFSEKDEKLYCISYHNLSYFLSELYPETAEFTDISSALSITNLYDRYKTIDNKSNSIILFKTLPMKDSTVITRIFIDEGTANETSVEGIFNPVFSFNDTNHLIGIRYDKNMSSGTGLLSLIDIETNNFSDISTINPGFFMYKYGNNNAKSENDSTIILVVDDAEAASGEGDKRFLCINKNTGNITSFEKLSLDFLFENIIIASNNSKTNAINDFHFKNRQLVYPNPAEFLIVFEFDQYPVKIQILNIQNRLLLEKTINEPIFNLNTSSFSSGIYIYNILFNNTITTGKFVLNK